MRQSKWNVTSKLDWDEFSTGETLTFVVAKHDTTEESGGFKFEVHGLLDAQGRFHVIGHSVEPGEHP